MNFSRTFLPIKAENQNFPQMLLGQHKIYFKHNKNQGFYMKLKAI